MDNFIIDHKIIRKYIRVVSSTASSASKKAKVKVKVKVKTGSIIIPMPRSITILLPILIILLKGIMASRVWCVNSGSRGIGLEFVNQLLLRPTTARVYAFLRDVNSSTAMKMKEEHKDRYIPVRVDNNDQATIDRLSDVLKQTLSSGEKIDGLVNVAGVLGGREEDLGPERSIQCKSLSVDAYILFRLHFFYFSLL